MAVIVIVGGTRGLGLELAKKYASQGGHKVYATARSPTNSLPTGVSAIPHVDVATPTAGKTIADALAAESVASIDILIISAGFFGKESFEEPDWDAEVRMYTTSAIGPVFIVSQLAKANQLREGTKIILVSSESGSIGLRHESEGGGNFAHHASKSASNMVGKLLSLDLKDKGVAVGIVHPGFMRTEMTKSVGFDKYWDDGGGMSSFVLLTL